MISSIEACQYGMESKSRFQNSDFRKDWTYLSCLAKQVLRRHGDEFERTTGGYYRQHGRADDTINQVELRYTSPNILPKFRPREI